MDWSALPNDILALIAASSLLSIQDLRAMRRACRGWLSALPATGGQWFAISRTRLDSGRVSASVWAISKAGELIPEQACLPAESSCWGGAWGSLAMRGLDGKLFCHMPVGGLQVNLPQMPDGMEPEGLFLHPPPLQNWPPLNISTHCIFGSRLHFQQHGSPWELEFSGMEMVRTACVTSIDSVYAAAYPNRLVMDGPLTLRPVMSTVPLDGLKPWFKNGHHLFLFNGNMHLCILCHPEDDEERTIALLFLVMPLNLGVRELCQRKTIGNNCLFLGANQPLICPSHQDFVGRRSNTIYIEHNDGNRRIPELLLIHLGTQNVNTIPFPSPLAEDIERFGPACWVHRWQIWQ